MTKDEYSAFYRQYRNWVLHRLNTLTRDRHHIEDISQEVWLNVWRSKDTFNPELSKFSTWLTNITDNTKKTYLEKHVEQQVTTISDTSMSNNVSVDDSGSVDSQSFIEGTIPSPYFAAEDEQFLFELLFRAASLSEQEAVVFNLVYWHGHSYEATAKRLGISIDTVGPIVSRLRTKFEVKELYHKAWTYNSPGRVWASWADRPTGAGNKRMGGIDGTESGLPLGGNGSTQWVSRPDLVEKYNNGITNSYGNDCASLK